jgi:hypothetical protein
MARLLLKSLLLLLALVVGSYFVDAKSMRSRNLAAELQKGQPAKRQLSKRATDTSEFRFYNNDTAREIAGA